MIEYYTRTYSKIFEFILHSDVQYDFWLNTILERIVSVPQEYVDEINALGGKLPDAIGIPEEQLRLASKSAVCKINIDSDSRLAFTAAVRRVLHDKPGEFDPRKFCGPARDETITFFVPFNRL